MRTVPWNRLDYSALLPSFQGRYGSDVRYDREALEGHVQLLLERSRLPRDDSNVGSCCKCNSIPLGPMFRQVLQYPMHVYTAISEGGEREGYKIVRFVKFLPIVAVVPRYGLRES